LQSLANSSIEHFNSGLIDRCIVFYSKPLSVMTQQATHKQIIPLVSAELEKKNEQDIEVFECKPSADAVLYFAVRDFIASTLHILAAQTLVSEYGARMTAMDGATRNTKKMITKLTALYNRMRQSMVTTELSEIISGVEALR